MLKQEDYDVLDNRYVQKDDCNTRHENLNKEVNEISLALTKLTSQLSMIIKITSAILGTAGAAVIAALMKLIIK